MEVAMEARQITSIINSMSPEQKQHLAEQIELNQGVAYLLGRKINQKILTYTETLLAGGAPAPLRHNNPDHRNGIIYGYLWRKR
jgi:hypothetical protein